MKKSVWRRDVGVDGNEYKMVHKINALSLWNNVVFAQFPYLNTRTNLNVLQRGFK